jgi:hypothetical protein
MDMRIANAVHESRPWRIREIVPDFTLEDVWALPVEGGAGDNDLALELMTSLDPSKADALPARALWILRDQLGRLLSLGRITGPAEEASAPLPIPGTAETSLRERLPDDLRGTADDVDFGRLPFVPLFRTDDEFAAEISNQTVHGVLHLAWVEAAEGRYQAQMAVYVKPRGRLGEAYMALIKPFRYWIVYPALMRQVERTWARRQAQRTVA